jgi:hypothetical protein
MRANEGGQDPADGHTEGSVGEPRSGLVGRTVRCLACSTWILDRASEHSARCGKAMVQVLAKMGTAANGEGGFQRAA